MGPCSNPSGERRRLSVAGPTWHNASRRSEWDLPILTVDGLHGHVRQLGLTLLDAAECRRDLQARRCRDSGELVPTSPRGQW